MAIVLPCWRAGARHGRGVGDEMTKSEYQELAEFIALRFDAIDRRFDGVDKHFDGIDQRFDSMDERLRRVEILGEDTRQKIQIVAGGVTGNSRRLDAFRAEVSAEFQEVADEFRDVRQLIQGSHGELDRRVTTLENRSKT